MPTRERRAKQLGISVDQLSDGRGKHGNHRRGSGHYRWNGDRITSSQGYVKVRVGQSHPLADPNGYVYEHLLVWVAAGNELPATDETIHHRNEDKTDNRIDNLQLLSRPDHNRLHNAARSRDHLGRFAGRTWDEMPRV